jgi:hypothetical protein
MNKADEEERSYQGPLGLDGLPPAKKTFNLILTVLVGTVLAVFSWFGRLFEGDVIYQLSPFAWPLIFLFAWPTCGVILWLRITGLKWRWSIFAAALVLGLYSVIHWLLYLLALIIAA